MGRHDYSIFVRSLFVVIVTFVCPNLAADVNVDAKGRQRGIRPLQSFPEGSTLGLTFKSKIDGSAQPLIVKIPKGYTPKETWPLLVTLHGLRDGPILAPGIDAMIQIGPYGRGSVWYEGIGEQDVFECIERAKELFSVDSHRLYRAMSRSVRKEAYDHERLYPSYFCEDFACRCR